MSTLELDLAVQHHQDGQLGEAERIYRGILERDPNHADAAHLLGLLAHQVGEDEAALGLIARAIKISSSVAAFHGDLGNVLQKMGRVSEAELCYREALRLDPRSAESANNLGNALSRLGRHDEAILNFLEALSMSPSNAAIYTNLAGTLLRLGRVQSAFDCYLEALRLEPESAGINHKIGLLLAREGRYEEAVTWYREAVRLRPDWVEALSNLGGVLELLGKSGEARVRLREALARDPRSAEAHTNLGYSFERAGELEEAEAGYRRAVAAVPGFALAHGNLGHVLRRLGRVEEALACCEEAIRLAPDAALAHRNRAILWLLQGRLREGWEEFEWRWKALEPGESARVWQQPLWDGAPLAGKTILLWAEQGLGDTIQFVRYAPLVKVRGGTVILECQPELVRLLENVPGVDRVIAAGDPLPDFDTHLPLLSLPRVFGTELESIPEPAPLRPRSATAPSRSRPGRLKVGLVWAGNRAHGNDANRSLSLAQLAPLAGVPGVEFLSLQKGPPAAEILAPPQGLEIADLSEQLNDFADTARAIEGLDLVISADTAVAHLAGAMGKPVWVLLPFAPDWRWLLGREDSPWYPTMRLFRHPRRGDWTSTVESAAAALKAWHG